MIERTMSFDFVDSIQTRSNLTYKKERKRVFIEREVVDVNEIEKTRNYQC